MDSKLRKILTECVRDIETGARDVEGCLQRHPDRAAELRPHLELWGRLNAAAKAQPNFGSHQRGKQQLLGALSDMERGKDKGKMIPAVAKVAVVMAAAALLVGGAAGASAALGGPDVSGHVFSTFGLDNAWDHAADQAKEDGRGLDTARDAVENGGVDGLDIAGQHANEAAQDGLNTAGEHAADGLNTAAEAQQQAGNDAGVPDGVDLPDKVPDGVPAGPKP